MEVQETSCSMVEVSVSTRMISMHPVLIRAQSCTSLR